MNTGQPVATSSEVGVKRKSRGGEEDQAVPSIVAKRRQYEILEEEEYVERIGKIIKRDFFPQTRQEERDAEKKGREEKEDEAVTLNQFLAKYNSEDNESFAAIQQKDMERLRKKKWWAFNSAQNVSTRTAYLTLQSLTNSTQPLIRNELLSKTNSPLRLTNHASSDGKAQGLRLEGRKRKLPAQGKVLHGNTRFEDGARESVEAMAEWDTGSVFSGKTEQTAKVSVPTVGGYSFLVPSNQAPVRPNRSRSTSTTRGFKVLETSEREIVAQKLARRYSSRRDTSRRSLTETERQKHELRKSALQTIRRQQQQKQQHTPVARPLSAAGTALLERLRKKKS